MTTNEHEFFISERESDKRLYISRTDKIESDCLSPCCMTIDDVDYEMSKGKNKEILEIEGMNQESFEYFVDKYGETYRYIYLFKCHLISDFSPFEKMTNLEYVDIFYNIRAKSFWDLSKNIKLRAIDVSEAKKLVTNMEDINLSTSLEELYLRGGVFDSYSIRSMEPFKKLSGLKVLGLQNIKVIEKDLSFLESLSELEEFHFDAGMLTVEEIAYICAKYPELKGKCLCAYSKEDAISKDVRICGFRKPELYIPEQQSKLDEYVKKFEMLVEHYKDIYRINQL